jgi:uncharacterized protein YqgC (DUF456 family)
VLELIGMIIFWLVLILGVVIIPFGVAGTFIIVADALIFGLFTGFEKITLNFIGLLLAIALFVELIEALLGALLARKFGGSKWGMIGAIVGGFIGAVLGTPVTPVLGTLLGGFTGAFIGAMFLELIHTSNLETSFKTGAGAFLGAVGGKITKIVAAVVMVVMIGFRVL